MNMTNGIFGFECHVSSTSEILVIQVYAQFLNLRIIEHNRPWRICKPREENMIQNIWIIISYPDTLLVLSYNVLDYRCLKENYNFLFQNSF